MRTPLARLGSGAVVVLSMALDARRGSARLRSAADADSSGRRYGARRQAHRFLSLARRTAAIAEVAGVDEAPARRDARLARRECAAGRRAARRARRVLRSRHHAAAVLQEGPRVLLPHSQGRGAGQGLYAHRRDASCLHLRSARARPVGQDQRRRVRPQPRREPRRGGDLQPRLRDHGFSRHRHAYRRADRTAAARDSVFRLGARRALRLRLAAHQGVDRAPGAAALLPPPARRRSQRRRTADRDERREGLLLGVRARGRGGHGVRDRRLLLEHARASGRSDRPRSRRRSTRARSSAPMPTSARTASTSSPTITRRTSS